MKIARFLAPCFALGCVRGCSVDLPPPIKPGVTTGQDFLKKTLALKVPELGGITDIALKRAGPRVEEAVIVAGTAGAAFLDPTALAVRKTVRLTDGKPPFNDIHIINADGDGEVEFFREPHAASEATLYDHLGHVVWKHVSPGGGFPHVTHGPLLGEEKTGFLFWSSSSDKVEMRDGKGEVRWSQRWERKLNELQVLDTDGDGKAEILYIDGESFRVRDNRGKLLKQVALKEGSYVNALLPIRYPGRDGRMCLCVGFYVQKEDKQVYRILELDGRTVKEIEPAELEDYLLDRTANLRSRGVTYRARVDRMAQQAPLAGYSATRLGFSVRDTAGELMYREVIASSEGERAKGEGAIAVLPAARGHDERFPVGYGPELWVYEVIKP